MGIQFYAKLFTPIDDSPLIRAAIASSTNAIATNQNECAERPAIFTTPWWIRIPRPPMIIAINQVTVFGADIFIFKPPYNLYHVILN
jgi:hypothetical protein